MKPSDARVRAGYISVAVTALTLVSSPVSPAQEISVVDDATNTTLTDGQAQAVNFGCTKPGVPRSRSFTVTNSAAPELVLPALGLSLPPGYTLNPPWPTALVVPEINVSVFKTDASASGDSESIFVDVVKVPSIISIQQVKISIPATPPSGGNTPASQFPYIDSDTDILISQTLTTLLDTDPTTTGPNSWACPNPNGDVCTQFADQVISGSSDNRWRTAVVNITPGKLSGSLDDPTANGELRFGFALQQLNPPYLPPGEQNDGDAYGLGGIDVSITLYNSQTMTTEVVSGKFVDDGIDNDASEVTLFGTPLVVPVPIVLGQNQSYTFQVGLNAATEGVYAGNWSLNTNDADEDPFNFPITGIVDGTPPTINGLPANIEQVVDPGVCSAVVSWVAPTAGDNLDPAPSLVQTGGPASGSVFPVGNHVIEYTATDCAGNQTAASFTVRVLDTEPPVLVGCLPQRIVASILPSEASVAVTYPPLSAFDTCDPNPVVVCTPPSGSQFPFGTTVVTCIARDSSGNESAPATFKVIVTMANPSPMQRFVEVVSERNLPAPGVAGAKMYTVSHALLNEAGSIVIEGTMLGAGANDVAVWKDAGGGLQLVSREGDAAPGSGLPITRFDDLILNDAGEVALEIFLRGATADTDAAHVSDVSGSLGLSLNEGDVAPGGAAVFKTLHEPAFDGQGATVTPANLLLGTGGVTVDNDTGVWRKPAVGLLEEVAREGSPVGPGLPGVNFGHISPRAVANENGEFAIYAFLAIGPGVTLNDNAAILAGPPGALAVVAREGQVAPGPTAAVFSTFAAESINSAGRVAFEANLRTGGGPAVTAANDTGLYTNSSGVLKLIVREGDPVSTCLGAAGGVFSSFRETFVADNGDVFFHAFLTGGAVGSHNDGGFWRWQASDSSLQLVLREGDVAPSTQGSVFAALTDFAVSDAGLHAVSATLTPGIGDCELTNNFGLWLDNGVFGVPVLKVREGDTVNLGLGGKAAVTVLYIDKTTNALGGAGGHGKVLNDLGEMILRASFDNNSSGALMLPVAP